MAVDYEKAYLALMQKKQLEDEAAQQGAPGEQDYAKVRDQQALGALVNSLNKSQALMGSVDGKVSNDTGFDNTQFANIAKGGLDDKAAKVQSLLKGNQDRFNLGRQSNADLMGVEKFTQDSSSQALSDKLSQGKFDLASQANSRDALTDSLKQQNMRQGIQQNNISLNDAKQERSYSPEANRVRQQMLQQQKQQMMAQGQNPMSIDAELANLAKADKLYQTAETLRATNPKKADELTKQLDSVINLRKTKQLNEMEPSISPLETKDSLSPAELAVDKNYAKDYNDWTSNGKSGVDKNLTRLEEAKQKLAQGSMISGRLTGRLPDMLRSTDSITTQQDVQAAAQGALRATLGAQFTEKEGERIMNMAYDPKLPPEENIRKIDLAIAEIMSLKNAQDSKASQYENKGTLKGFKSVDSVKPSETTKSQPSNSQPSKEDAIAELRRRGLIK